MCQTHFSIIHSFIHVFIHSFFHSKLSGLRRRKPIADRRRVQRIKLLTTAFLSSVVLITVDITTDIITAGNSFSNSTEYDFIQFLSFDGCKPYETNGTTLAATGNPSAFEKMEPLKTVEKNKSLAATENPSAFEKMEPLTTWVPTFFEEQGTTEETPGTENPLGSGSPSVAEKPHEVKKHFWWNLFSVLPIFAPLLARIILNIAVLTRCLCYKTIYRRNLQTRLYITT
jgi:hypothetical protein